MSCSGSTEERQNLKPQVWGFYAWMFLYSVALGYPNNPTDDEKRAAKTTIESLRYLLPCYTCREHFSNELSSRSLDDALRCSESFVIFLCDLENSVNERIGGPRRTCEESLVRLFNASEKKQKVSRMRAVNSNQYWHLIWIIIVVALVSVIFTWAIMRTRGSSSNSHRYSNSDTKFIYVPSTTAI
jgi:hypothetical protein